MNTESMSNTGPTPAIEFSANITYPALERETRSNQEFATAGALKSYSQRLEQSHGEPYIGENQSAHTNPSAVVHNGAQGQDSTLLTFRPYVYEDSVTREHAHRASPLPTKYGGRSTPVAHRYEYQMSSNETHSYLTETDGVARSHHTVQSYVAINPFAASIVQSLVNIGAHSSNPPLYPHGYPRPATPIPQPHAGSMGASKYILAFCFDTMPRQIYLHLLLRLPSLYFSRVARIFEDAELSMPDIKRMALASAHDWKRDSTNLVRTDWNFEPSVISPSFSSLKSSWEIFIDSLLREWKTLNIVSVLLLSAILTTLQIDAAASEPVTRYSALMSLVCALMSLLYGCMYIIRFGTMRKTHKAAEWAAEAQKTRTIILWNVWVLLAMPSIWLSWSIIFYFTSIMSFIWRTGSSRDPTFNLYPRMILGPRIGITFVFFVGLVYLFLIISTFSRYGDTMDRAWKNRVLGWAENSGSSYKAPSSIRPRASMDQTEHNTPPSVSFPLPRPFSHPELCIHKPLRPQGVEANYAQTVVPPPDITAPASFSRQPPEHPSHSPSFKTVKILDLRFQAHLSNHMPDNLLQRDIEVGDWETFISDASQAWDGQYPLYQRESGVQVEHIRVVGRSRPQDVVAQLVEWWNELFFRPRGTQAVLCQEISPDHPTSPSFAIYLLDLTVQTVGQDGTAGVVARFGSVPEGLDRIDVFDPPDSANSGRPSGRTMIFAGPHEAHVHWRRGTPIAQRYDPGSSIQTRESESRGSSPGRDLTRFEGGVEEDDEPEPAESEQNSVNYVHFQQV